MGKLIHYNVNYFKFNFYLACVPSPFSKSMTGTGWFSKMSTLSFSVQKGTRGGGDTGCTGATGCTGGDTGCICRLGTRESGDIALSYHHFVGMLLLWGIKQHNT